MITDNYSTAYIINKAKLNRKFARYVVDLAAFDMEPVFRAGRLNKIADHLSRYPIEDNQEVNTNNVNKVCLAVFKLPNSRILIAQNTDPFCKQVAKKLSSNKQDNQCKQYKEMYRYENEILVFIHKEHGREQVKIVIPFSVRQSVLKLCHDDSGHFDVVKTLAKIRSRYWWSTMRQDTRLYIKGCETCQQINRRTTLAYGMMGERPLPTTPFEIVSSDHLSLPVTKAGNCYILAHICHATRYLLAKPTCTTATDDIIHTIENDLIYHYGPPLTYISDNATPFSSQKLNTFLSKYGITHSFTPPYTPQANGLIERANATMLAVLSKFALEFTDDWDQRLPNLILAINSAKQSSTQFSPFYLLHGFQPRIPIGEIQLGTVTEDISRLDQINEMNEARSIAVDNLKQTHVVNKKRFDKRRQHHTFKTGDLVWYEWHQASDNKLSPKYKGPYTIVKPVGTVCYRISKPNSTNSKDEKVVHVQSLKPYHKRPNLEEPYQQLDEETYQQPDEETFLQVDEEPKTNHQAIPSVRQSNRTKKTPHWLNNFVLN